MMMRSKLTGLTVAIAMLAAPAAHALDLAAVGVLNFHNFTADPEFSNPPDSKLGFGFGGLATFSFAPMVGLQVGALYVPQKIEGSNTVTYNTLQIPVAIRVSPIDLISVGVGGYFAAAMGDKTVVDVDTGAESTATFADDNAEETDIGLLGSVAVKLPVAPLISIVADARYLFGLSEQSTDDTVSIKNRDIQFLVGVNFGL